MSLKIGLKIGLKIALKMLELDNKNRNRKCVIDNSIQEIKIQLKKKMFSIHIVIHE